MSIRKAGDNMKARSIQKVLIVASMFVSFVIYLCVSVADITPFFFIVALCVMALALDRLINRAFTAVKLFTQKAE